MHPVDAQPMMRPMQPQEGSATCFPPPAYRCLGSTGATADQHALSKPMLCSPIGGASFFCAHSWL